MIVAISPVDGHTLSVYLLRTTSRYGQRDITLQLIFALRWVDIVSV